MPRRLRLFAVVAPAALALDQASKAWARAALVPGRPRPVLALGRAACDLELSHNTGAAFSLLAGAGGTRVLLSLVALAAAAAMAAWLARARDAGARLALGLSLGAAGALGNAIDRVAAGRVTDFVLWRWGAHRWPIFNVADAALVVGVALLLLRAASRNQTRKSAASGAALREFRTLRVPLQMGPRAEAASPHRSELVIRGPAVPEPLARALPGAPRFCARRDEFRR